MGFTGLLILARTGTPLSDLRPLAGHDAEFVSRRADDWQLAAVAGHVQNTPDWAVADAGSRWAHLASQVDTRRT